ncbi:hypothetical protein [Streptomyces sp. 2A115]|uniref:hypothetical protein n=1 Tax=Streptomyces sp. 2A115 TaxID=3457439 RepID=UPI003FD5ECEA
MADAAVEDNRAAPDGWGRAGGGAEQVVAAAARALLLDADAIARPRSRHGTRGSSSTCSTAQRRTGAG